MSKSRLGDLPDPESPMYNRLFKLAYQNFGGFINSVKFNRSVVRAIYGVRLPKHGWVHWDFTTYALRNALKRYPLDNLRVLEMGTGPAALLSIYLDKTQRCIIHAVDIDENNVKSSIETNDFNKSKVKVFQSDLFSNVHQQYDLVFFNPPYVPTKEGRSLAMSSRIAADSDVAWDGGDDGLEVIRAFFTEAFKYVRPNGRIMLGLQDIYISGDMFQHVLDSRYRLVKTHAYHGAPSSVYLVRPVT